YWAAEASERAETNRGEAAPQLEGETPKDSSSAAVDESPQALAAIRSALEAGDRKKAVKLRCVKDKCTVTEFWIDAFRSRANTDGTKRTAFNRWQASRRDTPSWADALIRSRLLMK